MTIIHFMSSVTHTKCNNKCDLKAVEQAEVCIRNLEECVTKRESDLEQRLAKMDKLVLL